MSDSNGQWRSRIVEYGTEDPDQLLANPRNWRIHPKHQQHALSTALDQVGWAAPVIVNRRTGHVIDGHLRVGLALSRGETEVPVAYVDLTVAEEQVVLATFDPIASMAITDVSAHAGLLADLEAGGQFDALLAAVSDAEAAAGSAPTQAQIDARGEQLRRQFDGRGDVTVAVTCPQCGHDFDIGGHDVPASRAD
jgi:ParB-like chromosome segregation protein Spo0J